MVTSVSKREFKLLKTVKPTTQSWIFPRPASVMIVTMLVITFANLVSATTARWDGDFYSLRITKKKALMHAIVEQKRLRFQAGRAHSKVVDANREVERANRALQRANSNAELANSNAESA